MTTKVCHYTVSVNTLSSIVKFSHFTPDDDGELDFEQTTPRPYSQDTTRDSDGDGIPDYLDNDDDNDGISDQLDADDDGDGIPDLKDLVLIYCNFSAKFLNYIQKDVFVLGHGWRWNSRLLGRR